MAYHKAEPAGRAEREALWASLGPGVRRDDLNDALAALWTARRIAPIAIEIPASSVYDALGRPMRIVS
jgi:hypothetical protein